MAVVQYTAIVNQLRGKLNGSQFNKTKNSGTLQRKSQQSRGVRGDQTRSRSTFASVQRSWSSLSAQQHEDWQACANSNPVRDRFGNLVVSTGYNTFIRCNVNRATLGYPVLENAYTATAPSAALNMVGSPPQITFDPQGDDRFIYWQPNLGAIVPDPDFMIVWYIGLPVSNGVTNYHKRFVTAGAFQYEPVLEPFDGFLRGRYPSPVNGQRVFTKLDVVHVPSGIVVNSQVFVTSFLVS